MGPKNPEDMLQRIAVLSTGAADHLELEQSQKLPPEEILNEDGDFLSGSDIENHSELEISDLKKRPAAAMTIMKKPCAKTDSDTPR